MRPPEVKNLLPHLRGHIDKIPSWSGVRDLKRERDLRVEASGMTDL
jgi:hypothetical protein